MSTTPTPPPGFTLTISSDNAASISAQFTGDPGCPLNLNTNLSADPSTQITMVSGTQYGPYTQYYNNPYYPDDKTQYPGGQVFITLNGQQCGLPTNAYQTVVFLDTDDDGNLEAWAFNGSMTPATPHSGSLAQFATFTAAYGNSSTTPSATDILKTAMGLGAPIKTIKNGLGTWQFANGQCFAVNFQIQSS
jgi:hypothetical protein